MPSKKSSPRLILASASPRRRELLQKTQLRFRIIPSQTEETHRSGETPETYVTRVAAEKAGAVAQHHPGFWVLAADTIVTFEGQVFGKPANPDSARQMLTTLSGQTHQVLTAFILLDQAGNTTTAEVVTSQVTFKALSETGLQPISQPESPLTRQAPMPFKARGETSSLGSPVHAPMSSAYQWTR